MELPDRWAGVLLHPTSLPGSGAAGTLGTEALAFIDRIADMGFHAWQVLPLCPPGAGASPYASWSAMLGSPTLIDLPLLADEGLLDEAEAHPGGSGSATDLTLLDAWHMPMLRKAAERFRRKTDHRLRSRYRGWVRQQRWLVEAARFAARKDAAGGAPWWEWPAELRSRDLEVLTRIDEQLADQIAIWRVMGFFFDLQWSGVRQYAERRKVALVGDLPIYVSDDSADCWSRPDLFLLDRAGRPTHVAGCPPDYFSPLGQRWGNPLYRWEAHAADNYRWWLDRVRRTLEHTHLVRVDHFRGFSAGWAIPADAPDARTGEWRDAPGDVLFTVLRHALDGLPLIAEDLGHLDEGVYELLRTTRLPGTRVLQFGFDGDPNNPHHPDNIGTNAIVYTGTHDNETAVGWFQSTNGEVRHRVSHQLGCTEKTVAKAMASTALDCAAQGAVIPMQDLLGLGNEARMNVPGTGEGNWTWRATSEQLDSLDPLEWASLIRDSRRA